MESVKETVELMDGLKLLAVQAKKVLADGKVGVSDLPVLLETLKQVSAFGEAVKGAEKIPAEIKDLSPEEAQALLAKVFEIIAAMKAA